MNRRMLSLVLAVLALGTGLAVAKQWETDFEKAAEEASTEGKYMLLDFSGSDWCGWCVKLEQEVFEKKAFRDYAKDNLVCVLVDFPRGKPQSAKLIRQNKELALKYSIKGYPTVIILNPAGEKVAATGYREGGADKYVEHLKDVIDKDRAANPVKAAGTNTTKKVGLTPKNATMKAGGASVGLGTKAPAAKPAAPEGKAGHQ